ncbi:hypothetical protein [Taklimakanibacter albus]|uniref:Uncharacterized protein n=1 Tax=Taklimakanibacter albus TaxID=2800327 RepID=A0ACC5QYI1_9HYPH|nr:hypothetical protein [Aestuariivirga sp. YIM B02566]MBK1865266.1 hypothetical protein [Aestuariivirga sp. YIM B02566]
MTHTIGWDHGLLAVDRFGGRLGPVLFVLPDGRQVAPLAVAPWFSEKVDLSLTPLFHRLRGEWPCVPFGKDVSHGYSASQEWDVLEASDSRIRLAIAYPDAHPIRRLERIIRPLPDRPAIDLELIIDTREDCRLPVGLHPTLGAGPWFIDLPPETSVATPNSIIAPIASVPTSDGAFIDARHFPPDVPTEELLQVLEANGRVGLINKGEGYRLDLTWNEAHFPSLLLWISHRGLMMPPWNGRTTMLGVEPVCSAFDLGTTVAQGDNPIKDRGIATTLAFRAGETFRTQYRLAAQPIQ